MNRRASRYRTKRTSGPERDERSLGRDRRFAVRPGQGNPDDFSRAAEETGSPEPVERSDAEPGAALGDVVSNQSIVSGEAADASRTGVDRSAAEPSSGRSDPDRDGEKPSDRGVLPGFMRQL